MLVERRNTDEWQGSKLPLGYLVERDADLLILHRSDRTFFSAFIAGAADPFEVEAAVWQDAD